MISKSVTRPSNLGNELLIDETKVLWTHLAQLQISRNINGIMADMNDQVSLFLSSCKPHWPTTIFHKRTNERLRTRRKRCWLRTSINRPPAESDQTMKLFYKITSNEVYSLEHVKLYIVLEKFAYKVQGLCEFGTSSCVHPSKRLTQEIRDAFNPRKPWRWTFEGPLRFCQNSRQNCSENNRQMRCIL